MNLLSDSQAVVSPSVECRGKTSLEGIEMNLMMSKAYGR